MPADERPNPVPPEVFYTGETYAYRASDGSVVLLGTQDLDEARQLAGLDEDA